jgi:hypothetical protein
MGTRLLKGLKIKNNTVCPFDGEIFIFFIDSLNLNFRKNIWCPYFHETGPFEGMWIKEVDEPFFYFYFTSLQNNRLHG